MRCLCEAGEVAGGMEAVRIRSDCPKERNRKRTSKVQKESKRYQKNSGVCGGEGGVTEKELKQL